MSIIPHRPHRIRCKIHTQFSAGLKARAPVNFTKMSFLLYANDRHRHQMDRRRTIQSTNGGPVRTKKGPRAAAAWDRFMYFIRSIRYKQQRRWNVRFIAVSFTQFNTHFLMRLDGSAAVGAMLRLLFARCQHISRNMRVHACLLAC